MSIAAHSKSLLIKPAEDWFATQGWSAFPFQRKTWHAYLDGNHGLLHSATGTGKTLAVWMGPLLEYLRHPIPEREWTHSKRKPVAPPLLAIWVTPLKALAADTEQALSKAINALELPWTLEGRTGDTKSSVKQRQRERLPTALVITPESLTLLLSYPESKTLFQSTRAIIVDEWHELMGSKRGTQTELALARLSRIAPKVKRWALSATLGNLDQALACLVGNPTELNKPNTSVIVHGESDKKIRLESAVPKVMERFPWSGHLGLTMAQQVIELIDSAESTLVFTNTRNQTELWYQELLRIRPDWAGLLALHHGSLDTSVRGWVENALRASKLKAVVCTSSLDLGVDFATVEQVIQIGSPKGIARLVQRAGRSGHQPNATSKLTFIPTHALELIELAAARRLMQEGKIEAREPILAPLDCLAQHAVTVALSTPYELTEFHQELQSTYSFQSVSRSDLEWCMRFVVHGGESLQAYPDFHRVKLDGGKYSVEDPKVARMHRMSIGTISSDVAMKVQYLSGQSLGTVEESFIAKIKPGDRFLFAGRVLELVHTREAVAIVRKAKGAPNAVPRWSGGRMPFSTQLAEGVRLLLNEAASGKFASPEMIALKPMMELQARWSQIPLHGEVLIETFSDRSGYHACIYPFEGRLVHEGLGAVLAYQWSQQQSGTYTVAVNDYGLLVSSSQPIDFEWNQLGEAWSPEQLEKEVFNTLNATEMCKRQFREIARIAGLVHSGFPGQQKRAKHLQASTNMFFDAFAQYDPSNLLLEQARREVLQFQLQLDRLKRTVHRIRESKIVHCETNKPTPLSFPLVVERMRERLTSESLTERVLRLQTQLEQFAN